MNIMPEFPEGSPDTRLLAIINPPPTNGSPQRAEEIASVMGVEVRTFCC
jgi:hypothetical protein